MVFRCGSAHLHQWATSNHGSATVYSASAACFLVEKTTLSGEGIIKLLLSSTCICFTAWQQDKQFDGDAFCTSNSDGDSISDSDTFLLGFDISFVPGGNSPSGVGYNVLSAVPKLMMSLGTAIWMISGWYHRARHSALVCGRWDMSNKYQNPDKPGFRFSEQFAIFRWKPVFPSKFI